MFQIGDVLVSDDVLDQRFLCNLDACKGICCVEGDAGAPLELEEIAKIEEALPAVWNDLSLKARKIINKEGVAYADQDGQLVTQIVDGKDCVFTCYDDNGYCYCALEKAYRAGKTHFYKPISCHLYPIRVSRVGDMDALNYHRWSVCSDACKLGREKNLRVYQFLKAPLIRRYGEAWYAELEEAAEELIKRKYID